MADRTIATGSFAEALRGIAVGGDGTVWAAGDSAVVRLERDGTRSGGWATERAAFAIAVDARGRVWVGEPGQVEIFDGEGRRLDRWSEPADLGLVTAIAFSGDEVFLADAGARWIRRYDAAGKLLNNIGDHHRKGGFHIPNGVVDFAIDAAGVVHVANPGMHRVERYAPDGEALGWFGRFNGVDPAGFPGCCNPTNLTIGPGGRVIVSEKAGPRVKIYDHDGNFLSVVAADEFDPAAKNMDVAVDGAGTIYVADTARLEIRVFAHE